MSDFDVLFIKNYDYFYNEAAEALDILKNSVYFNLYKDSIEKAYICHNSLKEETIVKINGKFSIIAFEKASAAPPLSDFGDILNRYIRKHVQPAEEMSRLIEIYNSENIITSKEIEVFYAIFKISFEIHKNLLRFLLQRFAVYSKFCYKSNENDNRAKERTRLYINKGIAR